MHNVLDPEVGGQTLGNYFYFFNSKSCMGLSERERLFNMEENDKILAMHLDKE